LLGLEEEQDEFEERLTPITSDAFQYLSEFRRYVEEQNNGSGNVFNSINVHEDFLNLNKINSTKQSVISKYIVNFNYLMNYCIQHRFEYKLVQFFTLVLLLIKHFICKKLV